QITLPGTDEQVIYNPSIWEGILQVNTTIPSASTIYSCTVLLPTGWTVLIDPATGGGFSSSPFLDTNGNPMTIAGVAVSGVQTNGTGSITNISAGGQNFWLTDTSNGTPVTGGEQAVAAVAGHRVTWSELR
ncbi:MAG TPA: pilus assembly protein PilY, partial [Burkholderiaceae bacterium]|nr:pilus assembly protein PilY [Burkholderiaceae bacterium]